MKKITAFILILVMLVVNPLSITVKAASEPLENTFGTCTISIKGKKSSRSAASTIPVAGEQPRQEQIITKVSIAENGSRLIEYAPKTVHASRTALTASKTYNYINADCITEWSAIITGSFTYNGSSSSCTSSSCSTTVYSGNWKESANTATYAGNSAFASVTMQLRFLFVVIKNETCTLSLTCDKDGNLV